MTNEPTTPAQDGQPMEPAAAGSDQGQNPVTRAGETGSAGDANLAREAGSPGEATLSGEAGTAGEVTTAGETTAPAAAGEASAPVAAATGDEASSADVGPWQPATEGPAAGPEGSPVPEPSASDPGRAAGKATGYIAAALGGLILVAAVVLAVAGPGQASTSAASPAPSAAGSLSGSAASADDPTARMLGDAKAPLTIEVWADYQCPYCRALSAAIEPSLEREYVHSGEGKIVFQDFAFLGPESIDAAVSARCAGEQGAYWRYHDILYAFQQGENQGLFSPQNLAIVAQLAGLDEAKYTACVANPAVRSAIVASTSAGSALGVTATPTLRFIGPAGTVTLTGVPAWPKVKLTVDQVMGRAPMPTPAPSPSPSPPSSPAPSGPATSAPSTAPGPTATPGASPSAKP